MCKKHMRKKERKENNPKWALKKSITYEEFLTFSPCWLETEEGKLAADAATQKSQVQMLKIMLREEENEE